MDEQFGLGIDLMIRGLDCENDDSGCCCPRMTCRRATPVGKGADSAAADSARIRLAPGVSALGRYASGA
jgi:hypothetical protein